MWVFTTIGFFSIVAHRALAGHVMIRGRTAADLDALAARLPSPHPDVRHTPQGDYAYRIVAKASDMADALAALTREINYDNFKNAVVERQGIERARVYHEVWADLLPLEVALPESEADAKAWRQIREHMSPGAIGRFRDGAINHGISFPEQPSETGGTRAKSKPIKAKPLKSKPRAAKVKSKSTKEDPDAGMMPDTRSEAQKFAELKASMDPPLLERMVDQAKGEDVVTGSSTDKIETFEEWVEREQHSVARTSEDPPLKPQRRRALRKKT